MKLHIEHSVKDLLNILDNTEIISQMNYGIIFYLSNLEDTNNTSEMYYIAANVLRDKLPIEGGIYILPSGDIVVLCHSNDNNVIDDAIFQIKYLLSDDVITNQGNEAKFYTNFDLNKDWDIFYDHCMYRAANSNISSDDEMIKQQKVDYQNEKSLLMMLINQVEEIIGDIDLTDITNIAAVYIKKDNTEKKIFDELELDEIALKKIIYDKTELAYDINLYNFIREFIDVHLMILLVNIINQSKEDIGYCIDLNLNTMLSEEFDIFDSALKESTRRAIIIGIHIGDIYRDWNKYSKIRSKLEKRGYKICITGVDHKSFLFVDRKFLKADLIKLNWSSEMKQMESDFSNELKSKIQVSGSSRIVLVGNTEQDVSKIAEKYGLSLYKNHSKLNKNSALDIIFQDNIN